MMVERKLEIVLTGASEDVLEKARLSLLAYMTDGHGVDRLYVQLGDHYELRHVLIEIRGV